MTKNELKIVKHTFIHSIKTTLKNQLTSKKQVARDLFFGYLWYLLINFLLFKILRKGFVIRESHFICELKLGFLICLWGLHFHWRNQIGFFNRLILLIRLSNINKTSFNLNVGWNIWNWWHWKIESTWIIVFHLILDILIFPLLNYAFFIFFSIYDGLHTIWSKSFKISFIGLSHLIF